MLNNYGYTHTHTYVHIRGRALSLSDYIILSFSMTTVVSRTHLSVRYIAWLVCSESSNESTLFGRYNTMFFLQTLLVAILNIIPNYRCKVNVNLSLSTP
jgi:hypothetical protein